MNNKQRKGKRSLVSMHSLMPSRYTAAERERLRKFERSVIGHVTLLDETQKISSERENSILMDPVFR